MAVVLILLLVGVVSWQSRFDEPAHSVSREARLWEMQWNEFMSGGMAGDDAEPIALAVPAPESVLQPDVIDF